MQRALLFLVCSVALAACFSPEYGPCALRCDPAASEDRCPGDLACGTDGFCHADGADLCTAPSRDLEVSLTGTGTGTVSSDVGGISCGALCTGSVPTGTTVTFTAEPASGSRFTGWTGACSGVDPCVIEVDDDVSIGAGFNQARSLTIAFIDDAAAGNGHVTSAAAGIDCTDDCVVAVDANSSVSLTATPDLDSRFIDWGGACSGAACQVTMDTDKTVAVRYRLTPEVSVTVAGSGDGTVTSAPIGVACPAGACAARYDIDTAVSLTALATTGSRFGGWAGDCANATGACDLVTSADRDVTATFIELEQLGVTHSGSGIGTVTSSIGGINCTGGAGTCTADLDLDTVLTVSAIAAGGSRFGGWSNACSGALSPCSVTMDAPKTVDAAFLKTWPLSLTLAGSGTGTVTTTPPGTACTSSCDLTADDQQVVTLVAAPDGPSRFGGWSGACTNLTGPCVTTITALTNVTATFIRTYQLDVTIAGSVGRVQSVPTGIDCPGTCSAMFDTGASVSVTALPDPGVELDAWSGDCTGLTCAVTMTADRAVTVNLEGGHLAWSKRYGGSPSYGYETVYGVASDAAGASVVVGVVSGGTDLAFGGTTGTLGAVGARDAVVVAYAPAGAVRWARMYGSGAGTYDGAAAVALAPDGDVIVVGAFYGTINLGGGHTATAAGGQDGYVARLDGVTGATEWVVALGTGNTDEVHDVAVSAAGDILVIGACNGEDAATTACAIAAGAGLALGGHSYDVVAQLHADGSFGWSRLLQRRYPAGGGAVAAEVVAAADGDAIVAGTWTLDIPDWGGGPIAPFGTRYTGYLVRFEAADGAHAWSRAYGGSGPGGQGNQVYFTAAALDPAGDVVVAGWFDSSSTGSESFAGVVGGATVACAGGTQIVVARYDADDGAALGVFATGGADAAGIERPTDLAIDPSGDLALTGVFDTATTRLGTTELTNVSGVDGFIAKLAPSGAVRWAQRIGNTVAGVNNGWSELMLGVAVDADGRVEAVGYYDTDPANGVVTVDGTSFPALGPYEALVLTFGP